MQALERIVDPLGGEQGERLGRARRRPEGAVGDRIVDQAHVGQRERVLQRADPVVADVGGALLDHERQRHAPVADADHDGCAVVLQKERDLVPVVLAEQRRPGQRRAVDAGIVERAVGEAGIEVQLLAAELEAQVRIEGVDRLDRQFALREAREGLAQDQDALVVDLGDPGERGIGIGERLEPGDAGGGECGEGRRAGVRAGHGST